MFQDCTTWGRWKGRVLYSKTLEWEVNWDWYTNRNALAGFMLMRFCTICLVNTTLTGMGSILQIKTCLLQKFNPWKFSAIQLIMIPRKFLPQKTPSLYSICYYFLTICHFSYKLEYRPSEQLYIILDPLCVNVAKNYIIFAAIVIPIFMTKLIAQTTQSWKI